MNGGLAARAESSCPAHPLLRGAGYRKLILRMVARRCRGMAQSADLLGAIT
jgi:hypothetical protein